MWACTLLRRTYCLNEKETKRVSLYFDDDLRSQVKIESPSGHALLNDTQWFILLTFKYNIPKGKVHELRDWRNTLSVHCGLYILIMVENAQVLPN